MTVGSKLAEPLPTDADAWAAFFGGFADVVLVANSEAVDIEALKRRFGGETLFVFFNKTYKVLAKRFERPALLVARSSAAGANIVYRREVAAVTQPFAASAFRGVLNLVAARSERFSGRDDFEGRAVGFLDLATHYEGFYPAGRVPSSGFALAVWLAERRVAARIHLAGFSARRSERWKLFAVHDWTFEQVLLRLLARARALRLVGDADDDAAYLGIAQRFPGIAPGDVALAMGEVVSQRLANTDAAVDRLFSLTRWQAGIDGVLRSLKPRTRKQRLADRSVAREDGLAKNGGSD